MCILTLIFKPKPSFNHQFVYIRIRDPFLHRLKVQERTIRMRIFLPSVVRKNQPNLLKKAFSSQFIN